MLSFLAGLAIIYVGALVLLYVFQRNLMYFPNAASPDIAATGAEGLLQPAAYRSADGIDLISWFRPPPSPDAPVLLHFHGNAGHIGDRTGRIVPYAEAGMGILLAEYRGFGGNGGAPTEQGLYADARAAIDFPRTIARVFGGRAPPAPTTSSNPHDSDSLGLGRPGRMHCPEDLTPL